MFFVFGMLVLIAVSMALLCAVVHIGYAVFDDVYPRSVWDWLVVFVCVALLVACFPAASQLGRWQAERDLASITSR